MRAPSCKHARVRFNFPLLVQGPGRMQALWGACRQPLPFPVAAAVAVAKSRAGRRRAPRSVLCWKVGDTGSSRWRCLPFARRRRPWTPSTAVLGGGRRARTGLGMTAAPRNLVNERRCCPTQFQPSPARVLTRCRAAVAGAGSCRGVFLSACRLAPPLLQWRDSMYITGDVV